MRVDAENCILLENFEDDGFAAWRALVEKYTPIAAKNVAVLFGQLFNTKSSSFSSIEAYLAEMKKLQNQINKLQRNGITDGVLAEAIVKGLPTQIGEAIALQNEDGQSLTLAKVENKLRSFAKFQNQGKTHGDESKEVIFHVREQRTGNPFKGNQGFHRNFEKKPF